MPGEQISHVFVLTKPDETEPERQNHVDNSLRKPLLKSGFEILWEFGLFLTSSEQSSKLKDYGITRSPDCKLGIGKVGCYLSHVKVWRRIVEERINCAMVLEERSILDHDDNPSQDSIFCIRKLVSKLPAGWHTLHLHSFRKTAEHPETSKGHPLKKRLPVPGNCDLMYGWDEGGGSLAYVVSYDGAKRLLTSAAIMLWALDGVTNGPSTNYWIELPFNNPRPAPWHGFISYPFLVSRNNNLKSRTQDRS